MKLPWVMLLSACVLSMAFMAVIDGMIPKIGVRMDAPKDIQEAMMKLADKTKWIMVTGMHAWCGSFHR